MRLLKRGKAKNWTAVFEVRKRKFQLSTKTADKQLAWERALDLLKEKRALGGGKLPYNPDWISFKVKYLTEYSNGKNPQTHYRDKLAIRNLEVFKLSKLSDVSPELLERFKVYHKNMGRGNASINRELRAIKAMMRKAETWKYLGAQHWSSVGLFKESKGRTRFYSVSELKRLLSLCSGVWETICLLGARAGLRRDEMRHLRWEDVNFEKKRIYVTPNNGWTPKDYEERWIPLDDLLFDHLQKLKLKSRQEWVLDPRPSLGSITTYFRRIVKRAGLSGGPHTLRHTFGSHLGMSGIDNQTLQKYMGHADMGTTAIYIHTDDSHKDKQIQRLPPL